MFHTMPEFHTDPEVLIFLVKSRPVLWDKTSEIYKDRKATKAAWEEVCMFLNKRYETLDVKHKNKYRKEVLRRWTNVRDAFAKFCRREKEAKKNDTRLSKGKKYIYHRQLRFLRKLYDPENAQENDTDNDPEENANVSILLEHLMAPLSGAEAGVDAIYPRTRSQDNEILITSVRSQPQSRDAETMSDAGGENSLTSDETASTVSQLSSSIPNKRKRPNENEPKNSNVLDGEKSERHLSFFKGIIPSLEELNEQEVLKFQMGVLQLIGNISDQRRKAPQIPTQFFPYPSQHGPSAYPFAASYPPGQPVFPTFWSPVCQKCNSEPKPKESSSKPKESSSKPKESSSKPKESSSKPKESSSNPVD